MIMMMKKKSFFALIVTALVCVLMLNAASAAGTRFDTLIKPEPMLNTLDVSYYTEAADTSAYAYGVRDCRYGIVSGLSTQSYNTDPWMDTIKASWYVNFFGRGESTAEREHYSMVKLAQVFDSNGNRTNNYTTEFGAALYQTHARNHPGKLWIIGNEPDRRGTSQDNVEPAVYARAYHEVRAGILAADPTARFGHTALVQVTPSRIQYLDTVWNTYQTLYGEPMPVDVWTMHIYILPELEPDQSNPTPNGIASLALGSDLSTGIFQSDFTPPDPYNYLTPAQQNDFRADAPDFTPPYISPADFATYQADLAATRDALNCNSGDPTSAYYNHVGQAAVDDNVYCNAEHDDLRIFKNQVFAMRQWMADHGQKEKPLIITEMGTLWPYYEETQLVTGENTCALIDEFGECFDQARVSRYLSGINDYLLNDAVNTVVGYSKDDNRLVQQWAWYSVYQYRSDGSDVNNGAGNNVETGSSSNLVDNPASFIDGQPSALNDVGDTFLSYSTAATNNNTLFPDLIVDVQPSAVAYTSTGATAYPVTFEIAVRNTGNTSVAQGTVVQLFADAALTQPIGAATLPAGLGGCSVDTHHVTISGVIGANITEFYVKVDASNVLQEDSNGESNNVYADAAGNPLPIPITYEPAGSSIYLPVLTR